MNASAPYTVPQAEVILIAISAGSAAVLNSVVDTGSGGDMQSLAILGAVSCARSSLHQALSEAQWCLTPLRFGPAGSEELFGSFTLGVSLLILHFVIFLLVRMTQSINVDEQAAFDAALQLELSPPTGMPIADAVREAEFIRTKVHKERWARAGTTSFYPSVTTVVILFFFPGIMLRSAQSFMRGKRMTDGMAMAMASGAFALFVLVGLTLWSVKWFRGEWVPYKYSLTAKSSWLRVLVLPQGFWDPPGYVARFGFLFWSYRMGCHWFSVLSWTKLTAFAVIASIETTGTSCSVQFAVLTALSVVYVVVVGVLRPFRANLSNIMTIASNFSVGLVALSGFMEWDAFPKLLVFLCCCSLASGAVGCFCAYLETQEWKPEERAAREMEAMLGPEAALQSFLSNSAGAGGNGNLALGSSVSSAPVNPILKAQSRLDGTVLVKAIEIGGGRQDGSTQQEMAQQFGSSEPHAKPQRPDTLDSSHVGAIPASTFLENLNRAEHSSDDGL